MRLVLLFLMLAACGEKDFDQQYAETEKQLTRDAARLDRQMAEEAKKEPGETEPRK